VSQSSQARPMTKRTLQRLIHLVTGGGIATYIYFTPSPDSLLATGVRWVAFPALVASGVVMWQWARWRRRLKMRRSARVPS